MSDRRSAIGMVGLGTMGRNFLLNLADHGHGVAGCDRDASKVDALQRESAGRGIVASTHLAEMVAQLARPRVVMLLVPAGRIVDQVLEELVPMLSPSDVVIDGGNSHFTDTDRRAAALALKELGYLGVGVSGGAEGARHGPSLMPGGPAAAYTIVEPMLRDAAAKVDEVACVAHLGPGSAGHYVKMVHNGIEYGIMQLIAETYDLLHRGLGLDNDALAEAFGGWADGPLGGFLLDITANIFRQPDLRTGGRLVDVIDDAAGQKGTGMWTSQEALQQQVPTPTIDVAVTMRDLSGDTAVRKILGEVMGRPDTRLDEASPATIAALGDALAVAGIVSYAQGFALLDRGSAARQYGLDLATVARIWRGGCIIRSHVLEDIRAAYARRTNLPHLLADPAMAKLVVAGESSLRSVVAIAARAGIAAPAHAASLAYLDAYRSARLPSNLIQAQRDDFGAHTYRRVDDDGVHHTDWNV